ncbi:MAG: CTP synthase [bacterium]
MKAPVRIALIGEYDASVRAHQAIPPALELSAAAAGVLVAYEWLSTDSIRDSSPLHVFDGIWCVPATPYRSTDGALRAIRFARESPRPYLGTCGGFQYAIVEYARNVLGWANAEHAELAPDADRVVIAPLACALVEVTGTLRLLADSRIGRAYRRDEVSEGYHCRYAVDPVFQRALKTGPLRITATDRDGDMRALELDEHPFFVATLFQPERAALDRTLPPLVHAFVLAAIHARDAGRSGLRPDSGHTTRAPTAFS